MEKKDEIDSEILDPAKVEKIVRGLKTSEEELKDWEEWAKKNFGE